MLNLHKEVYKIGGVSVTCIADFKQNTLKILSSNGFKWAGSLDEYESFEGNMKDFAKNKLEIK